MTTPTARREFWFATLWLLIAALSLPSATAHGDDDLDALVADYRAYGLPMPPDRAKLSILRWSTGTVNDVPQYSQALAFVVEPEVAGHAARRWFGCRPRPIGPEITVKAAEPSRETLAETRPDESLSGQHGFATYTDLALAIQCAARGWDELARGLLARSRLGSVDPFDRSERRPLDDRAAVATLAWDYWCDQFVLERGDRAHIVARLTEICNAPHGRGTPAHRNIIEDMQKTLAPRQSAPDSVEYLIDSLVDLGMRDGSPDGSVESPARATAGDESYAKLEEMGLAAVPVLMRHTHDFRLTRCVESVHHSTWHARIADVVWELLNKLVPGGLAHDFLIREGRGRCADDAHVQHWWSEQQQAESQGETPKAVPDDGESPIAPDLLHRLQAIPSSARERLLNAVRAGDLAVVEKTSDEYPDLVFSHLADGRSPLHWAVIDNYIDIAKFLIAKGADVNQSCGGDAPTPIFSARTAATAKLLIEHGADLKRTSRRGQTPLQEAVRGGNVQVAHVLVAAGEKLDFDSAVELGDTDAVAALLAEQPWLAKPPQKPLYFAAGQGNLELATLLLQYGADPDIDFGFTNIRGPYTPLSSAVTSGHYELAELLLVHGASPNVSGGRNHDNLFLFAIAYLDARFVKLMLDHGADVVGADCWDRWERDFTPLHIAAALSGAPGVGRYALVGQPRSLEGDQLQVLEKVRFLVEAGADVNAHATDGTTPLLCAALAGHQQVCDYLLERGAQLDVYSACLLGKREAVEELLTKSPAFLSEATEPFGTPALHWAVRAGDVEVARLLLRHGAEVDARASQLAHHDAEGFSADGAFDTSLTALHVAARLGRENIVQLLLDHGAEIEALGGANDDLQTALDMACDGGHVGTIKLLLDRGAKVHLDGESRFPFDKITDMDLLARLLDAAGAASQADERGTKLIAAAVADKNTGAVDLLIARGAQLDIFAACALGRSEDVKRLLEATPDLVNAVQKDYPRVTPIVLAVEHGHVEIVRLMIAKGAKLSVADESRATILPRQAVMYGHLDVLQLLLASGCSMADRDSAGSTLLHAAAFYSRPEIARYLISAGADVNAADFRLATPLHVVGDDAAWSDFRGEDVEAGMKRIVATAKILLDAGADVHARDATDNTPLHLAAHYRLAGVAELLLEQGADVNARNSRDETPLSEAEDSRFDHFYVGRSEPIVELLKRHGGVQ